MEIIIDVHEKGFCVRLVEKEGLGSALLYIGESFDKAKIFRNGVLAGNRYERNLIDCENK